MRGLLYGPVFASLAGLAVTMAFAAEQSGAGGEGARNYCVNVQADFYEYQGGTCRSGYRLGPGNCRLPDGSIRALLPAVCRERGGMQAMPGDPIADPGVLLPMAPKAR